MREKVNSKSVLAVLRLLPVAASSSRKNVLQHADVGVESVTLGMSGPNIATVTNATWQAPTVFMLLKYGSRDLQRLNISAGPLFR